MKKVGRVSMDVPVKLFIRFIRKDDEPAERALLIAEDEKGRQFIFAYKDYDDETQDLIVCDFIPNPAYTNDQNKDTEE